MGALQFAVPLIAVIALIVIVLSGRWRARSIAVRSSALPAIERVSSRIRIRNVVAVVAALTVGAALANHGLTVPSDLGRSLLIAPLVTAAVAIGFFVIIPAFGETTEERSADLTRRTPLSFIGRRTLGVGIVLAAGLVVTTTLWGIAAEPDGRSIGNDFGTTDYFSAASPFPGFFYGIPVLIALAVLAAVTVVALSRIGAATAPSDAELRAADVRVRQLAVSVVMRVALAGIAFTLSFGLLIASQSTASVSSMVMTDGAGGTQLVRDEALRVLVVIEAIAALVLVCVAIALAVSAIVAAVRRPLAPVLVEERA